MTNAEKLAKDTERLSDVINGVVSSCKYCIYNYDDTCGTVAVSCFEGVQKWLEQEAEENDER